MCVCVCVCYSSHCRLQVIILKGELNPKIKFVLFGRTLKITEFL